MVSFWLFWFSEALRTVPDFMGNNWRGASFTAILIFTYERRSFLRSEGLNKASRQETIRHLGAFLTEHWRGTLKYWVWLLLAFYVGHTFDLVHQNAEKLTQNDQALSGQLANASATCTASKVGLEVENAFLKARGDTLAQQTVLQQASIDNCQTQAISRIKPLPLAVTADTVALGKVNTPRDIVAIVISTNLRVKPTNLTVICPQDFEVLSWAYSLGEEAISPRMNSGIRKRASRQSYPIDQIYPAFEPDKHFALIISLDQPQMPFFQCAVLQVNQ